jgi:phosphatidylserine decarboxylase
MLRRLPLHALTQAAGRLAAWRLPGPLQRAEIRLFGAAVGVDFAETRDPIASFSSLQEFFTRALRDGARPIDPAADAVVSPCDGAWGTSGTVEGGALLQLKGRPYSLGALLGSDAEAKGYEGGAYATLYLAPRDYHRFHMPCDARVAAAVHLPGSLWPVNRIGVEGVPGLFAENERIAASFERPGGARFAIVAVGATLVGKVRVAFDDLSTGEANAPRRRDYGDRDLALALAKGEEWGRFEFGSTLVLVGSRDAWELDPGEPGTPVRLGRRIGTLRQPAGATRRMDDV